MFPLPRSQHEFPTQEGSFISKKNVAQVGRNDNNIHGHDTKGSYKEVHQHVGKRLGRNEQVPASMGDSLLFLSFQVWFSKNHIIVVNVPPETQQPNGQHVLHHLWFWPRPMPILWRFPMRWQGQRHLAAILGVLPLVFVTCKQVRDRGHKQEHGTVTVKVPCHRMAKQQCFHQLLELFRFCAAVPNRSAIRWPLMWPTRRHDCGSWEFDPRPTHWTPLKVPSAVKIFRFTELLAM